MYTTERNCQIVIALLKAHGIHRIIASPGTTNIAFVGSVQADPFFHVYSAVDERHAGYLAVGMAAESGEPVVLSCTGATASRNYLPALTEAYYRKLPVLALTSSQVFMHLGQLHPQMIDRTQIQHDVANVSVWCPIAVSEEVAHYCERVVNEAILALKWRGGGPAHINLETLFSRDFTVEALPSVKKIERYTLADAFESWPRLSSETKIIIQVGAQKSFSPEACEALEHFCRVFDAVVFVSPVSRFSGFGAISSGLVCGAHVRAREQYAHLKPDLIIHIGEVSAEYGAQGMLTGWAPVWRVNEDGALRDLFGRLEVVYEMTPQAFFAHWREAQERPEHAYYEHWQAADATFRQALPQLPFCNNWIAWRVAALLPEGSRFHAGILSTIRSISYCSPLKSSDGFCNVGGFGIDGNTSTLIGASLCSPDKLFIGMVGDLSFFYDMNALGNRHIGRNIRLIVVNNGMGAEFTIYGNPGAQFQEHTKDYIAAGGHFAKQSQDLVRHFAQDLGFTYMSAHSQEELEQVLPALFDQPTEHSIVLECFVRPEDEQEAWRRMDAYLSPNRDSFRAEVGRCLPKCVKETLKRVLSM